jgi:hypothetical protein
MPLGNDELLMELVAVIRALRAQGVEAGLFGGLAVMLQTHEAADPDELPRPIAFDSPSGLLRVMRPTRDIDLALLSSANTALEKLGFHQDSRDEFKFKRADLIVDAVALESTSDNRLKDLLRSLDGEFEVFRSARLKEEIRVMGRAGLVVLKAVAWADRYLDKDLADLAQLAIDDLVRGGSTRGRLAQLLTTFDSQIRSAIRAAGKMFSSLDGNGPRAFCNVVRSNLSGRLVDEWEDGEERVAEIAAFAGARMLHGH